MSDEPRTAADLRNEIIREAVDLHWDVLVAAKQHFFEHRRWRASHDKFQTPLVVTTGILGAGLWGNSAANDLVSMLPPWANVAFKLIFVVLLPVIAGVIGGLSNYRGSGDRSDRHRAAGNALSGLRDEVRILLNIESSLVSSSNEKLLAEVLSLRRRQAEIRKESPELSAESNSKVRAELQGEDDLETAKWKRARRERPPKSVSSTRP